MNEHEQHKSPHWSIEGESPPAVEEVRTVYLDAPATDELSSTGETNVSVIREGIRRYGDSFLAYLVLDGTEQRSTDLIEQYEARTLGYFADRRSFAAWAIEDLGWNDQLVELRQLQGMGPDDVKWNLDGLWPTLVERYAITERLGGVHAFRR